MLEYHKQTIRLIADVFFAIFLIAYFVYLLFMG